LRQIGIAIHNYHDKHNCFPPGSVNFGSCCSSESYTSWPISILPFLEQGNLADNSVHWATNESPENKAVREQFVPLYVCASEPSTKVLERPESGPGNDFNLRYRPGSYRGVGGRSDGTSGWWDNYPQYKSLPFQWRGVFHVVDGRLEQETFSNLRDGTSNTLLVGEYGTQYRTRRRTFWAYSYGSYNRSDAVPQGRTLMGNWNRCTSIGGTGGVPPCNRAWGSFHPGTIQFLYGDGNVRPVSQTCDTMLFVNAATIDGGEPGVAP
jgi:hypothetical protein